MQQPISTYVFSARHEGRHKHDGERQGEKEQIGNDSTDRHNSCDTEPQ